MKTIQLDGGILSYLATKAVEIGEPAASVLRRELGLSPLPNSILVDDDVYDFLLSKMTTVGESAATIVRRQLDLDDPTDGGPSDGGSDSPGGGGTPPAGGAPKIVEFHIPTGTNAQPWNTRENPVVGAVGDTLRLVNDDSVAHRLHTDGKPFPHPASDIQPGATADLLLQSAFDGTAGAPLYDHDFGPAAQFFIRVTV